MARNVLKGHEEVGAAAGVVSFIVGLYLLVSNPVFATTFPLPAFGPNDVYAFAAGLLLVGLVTPLLLDIIGTVMSVVTASGYLLWASAYLPPGIGPGPWQGTAFGILFLVGLSYAARRLWRFA